MTAPIRIQRKRSRGWRMPPNTVYVGRPSKWGNPCPHHPPLDRLYATRAFVNWVDGCEIQEALNGPPPTNEAIRNELRGKNLACWCPLDKPCHADILLELANTPKEPQP